MLASSVMMVGLVRAESTRPGLAWVLFNDTLLQRPALAGTDAQVNFVLTGYNDCSRLWLGRLRFPTSGPVTITAEAHQGLRLYVADQCVIDGWTPQGPREGSLTVTAGRPLLFRLEYTHLGAEAFCRLYWQWPGHARELIPAEAFDHTASQAEHMRAIAAGREWVSPGNVCPTVPPMSAPLGDEACCASLYEPGATRPAAGAPLRLGTGPHLFVDDALIARSRHLTRRVNRPQRDPALGNPIVTGKGDHCFQPYLTVLQDPTTHRYRMWYGVYNTTNDVTTSHIATMESSDAIHWERPYRQLPDAAPIQFGVSVLDAGPHTPNPAQRYKLGWWKDGGLKLATSPDGLQWTALAPNPVLLHNHDINNIHWDAPRQRYIATVSVYTTGPTWSGDRRITLHSASRDLLHWEKPWQVLTPVDGVDEGQTQFYAMCGYLQRGDLWLGLVKVLRDDLRAAGTPEGSYGVGYTTLAWSRDGQHWVRDREPFFEPDPTPGAWDHAHAWIDCQLPVGDEVVLYYGGYKNGHKVNRFEERQIGLLRLPRDRYVARAAGAKTAQLRTPRVLLDGRRLTVNAAVRGELRAQLLGANGQPLPGFACADCRPVRGDGLDQPVQWQGQPALPQGVPVRLEFELREGDLYGFTLR